MMLLSSIWPIKVVCMTPSDKCLSLIGCLWLNTTGGVVFMDEVMILFIVWLVG